MFALLAGALAILLILIQIRVSRYAYLQLGGPATAYLMEAAAADRRGFAVSW